MDNIILDLLKGLDGKVDRISEDIATIKLKNVEQEYKIAGLDEKYGFLSGRVQDANDRIKAFEETAAVKRDVDALFDKVRAIEGAPTEKLKGRVSLVKKAVWGGIAALITGGVAALGGLLWVAFKNVNAIMQAVENLKAGG